ncbi:MAG: hypothetical protein ACPL0C_05130 [Candidatus Bathyarchaeales archaeon]
MKIRSIISIMLSASYIIFSILILWATLGWNVRRARKAFEKQLIRQGMAKKDARRISAQYSKLKNDVMNTLKRSMRRGS